MKKSEDATNEFISSIKSIEDGISKLGESGSTIEKLSGVLKSLSDGNGLSSSDVDALLGVSQDFIPYLNDEIGLRKNLQNH